MANIFYLWCHLLVVVLPGHWVKKDSEALPVLSGKECPLVTIIITDVEAEVLLYCHSCSSEIFYTDGDSRAQMGY